MVNRNAIEYSPLATDNAIMGKISQVLWTSQLHHWRVIKAGEAQLNLKIDMN